MCAVPTIGRLIMHILYCMPSISASMLTAAVFFKNVAKPPEMQTFCLFNTNQTDFIWLISDGSKEKT